MAEYMVAEKREMTDYERGQWDMFEQITSIYNGKMMYALEGCGTVYSRHSHKSMMIEDAYSEFLSYIGDWG